VFMVINFQAFKGSFDHFAKNSDPLFFSTFLCYLALVSLLVIADYVSDYAQAYSVKPAWVTGMLLLYVGAMSSLPRISKLL
jgi:hypothetical protein